MSDGEKSEAGDVFDVERIRRLVRLMEEHDLSEVDLRQQGDRINLKRGAASVPMLAVPQAPVAPMPAPMAAPTPAAAPPAPVAAPAEVVDGPNIVTIKAPMVGTFYSKPNPNSENFVKVGMSITPDTTICIIEAMKVFNEIPAEISGKVVAVLVDNEQPVEYGKPLFKIDTSA